MIVVGDASPIIGLAAVGKLNILKKLYENIYIPEAVYQEIAVSGDGQPGSSEVKSEEWIISHPVRDINFFKALRIELDEGEAEAIALAIEIKAELILIDEKLARNVALRLGLNVVGVLGILAEAKRQMIIDELKPAIDALIKNAGFRIGSDLYEKVLQTVGEIPG